MDTTLENYLLAHDDDSLENQYSLDGREYEQNSDHELMCGIIRVLHDRIFSFDLVSRRLYDFVNQEDLDQMDSKGHLENLEHQDLKDYLDPLD